MVQFGHEFVIGQQKKGDKSYPDLRHNGVLTRSQKALDLEILLDPFEKQLHLPPLPVDVGDGPRRKMKDVGQIHVVLSGLGIPVSHSTQNPMVFRRLGTCQRDELIRGDVLGSVHPSAFPHRVLDAPLKPGDKEDLLSGQPLKPREVHVCTVHDHDREGSKLEGLGHSDVCRFGVGDFHERRNVPVVIQEGMEFDPTLCGAETSPWKQREAEVHHGSIKRVELVLESESLAWSKPAALGVLLLEELLKESGGPSIVGISQGGTLHSLHAQVIKPGCLRPHLGRDIPQAGTVGEVCEHHSDKLPPAIQGAVPALGTVALSFSALKFITVKKMEQLAEDCVIMGHGLNLLSFIGLVVNIPHLIGDSGLLCSVPGRRTPVTAKIMSKATKNAVTPPLDS